MRLLGPVADKALRDFFIFFITLLLIQSEFSICSFFISRRSNTN